MKTILSISIIIILLASSTTIKAQNSIKSDENMNSAMLSLSYYYCLDKNVNAGDLFETHISTLKETAEETSLKQFKVENKSMIIYKQDSCYSAVIQLSASFNYNSEKVNKLYKELHSEEADEWEFALNMYNY